jgi:hypothetical protein
VTFSVSGLTVPAANGTAAAGLDQFAMSRRHAPGETPVAARNARLK